MKKNILLLFFLMIAIRSIGQVNQKNQMINSLADLAGLLVFQYYHPIDDSVKNSCWKGCVFIRFNIDKKRKIVNIVYNTTTPVFIADALNRGFANLNKAKQVMGNLRPYINKTFVLPLIIVNDEGCGFSSPWDGYSKKTDEKMAVVYDERRIKYDQFSNTIENMTSFNNERRLNFVDCVLLKPIYIPKIMN